mgnify:CR=1 FL=1
MYQSVTAVLADIVKCANLTLIITGTQNRLLTDLAGNSITRIWQLLLQASDQLRFGPDVIPLLLHELA